MNKFQILGIIAAGLALASVGTFYAYKPLGENMTKSCISQVLLALAVGVTAIALIMSKSAEGIGDGETYVPHVIQPQSQDFIMKEGLPARPKFRGGKGKPSLGRRLKDKGWCVVLAKWCGFCTKQQAFFTDNPELELDLLVVAEEEMTPPHMALNEGFPAFMNLKEGLKSPGLTVDLAKLEGFLTMTK